MAASSQLTSDSSVLPRPLPVTGLPNFANNCFANSVLQSVLSVPAAREALHKQGHPRLCPIAFDKSWCSACFLCELGEVNPYVHAERSASGSQAARASTRSRLVTSLLRYLSLMMPSYVPGSQSDAQEFWSTLVASADSDLKAATKLSSANASGCLQSIFGGAMFHTVTCDECKTQSERKEPFLDLSIEFPREPAAPPLAMVPLASLLSEFSKTERLTDSNRYFCSSCNKKTDASKKVGLRASGLPEVLVLHIKRYAVHNNTLFKVGTSISYPSVLDMSLFLEDAPQTEDETVAEAKPTSYRLRSAIVHLGASLLAGHYVSYVRRDVSHKDGAKEEWLLCDDQHIVSVPPEMALQQTGSVMLFYERSSTSSVTAASSSAIPAKL